MSVDEQDTFEELLAADPTDWKTRLLYADWLEEDARPRAAREQRWFAQAKQPGGAIKIGKLLDQDPADWLLREIYADDLYDAGKYGLERAQRWMIFHKRPPWRWGDGWGFKDNTVTMPMFLGASQSFSNQRQAFPVLSEPTRHALEESLAMHLERMAWIAEPWRFDAQGRSTS